MDALVEAATQGSSSDHPMHHRHNQHEEDIEEEEVIVEEEQEEGIEVDDRGCTEADFEALKQKYEKYLPQDDMDADQYGEEYVEELIDDEEILVDDDGLLEHEEVVYETVMDDGGNERDGIDSLVALSRGPLGSGKTVREFLGDIGATEEVHSTSHRRNAYGGGNVRVQAPSRLLPVATVKNMDLNRGRLMLERHNMNNFQKQEPIRDWREEQKRDLEICDFYDTLPADRQVAFRKMLERMGERVPKPIQGSRKYFRSTLAPHVKIPIPSNSKLEMLSSSIPIGGRSKMQKGWSQHDGNGMYYTTARDEEKKVVMFESVDEQGRPYVEEKAMEMNDDGEIVDVVAMQEEVIEEDGQHNMNDEQFVLAKDGDPEDQPAPLEPAFGPGEPVELPPPLHQDDEVEMPMLEKEPIPPISRPLRDRWFVVPELRKELIGKQHVVANRGNIEPNQRYCEGCNQFLAKGQFEHHQKKITRYGQCDYFAPRRFPCPEDECNHKMPNIEKLCMHLRISHKRPLDVKEQLFDNEEDFQIFLRDLEGKGGNFRMSRGNKGCKDGASVRYYRCNRNVRLKPRGGDPSGMGRLAGLRDPRLQFHSITQFFDNGGDVSTLDIENEPEENGQDEEEEDQEPGEEKPRGQIGTINNRDIGRPRNKPSKLSINGVCTAFFKKTDFPDGRIHVRYCDFHLHPDALLRLPDDVRHRIRELNIKRLPVPVIIKIVKAEIHSFCEPGTVLEDRILQLADKDVRNVLARADMKPIKLHICRNKSILDRPSFGEQVAVPRTPYQKFGAPHSSHSMANVTTESAEQDEDKMVPIKPDGDNEEQPIICNLPPPTELHMMGQSQEDIELEDEMLEAAVMNTDNVDPNRPPSPEALTELERAMFEEWQCEDVDHMDDMSKRRRETLLIKRKKEEVREKMNQVQILLQAEFYDSLNMDHLVRLDSIAEELFEMHASFEHKIRAAMRRNANRAAPRSRKKKKNGYTDKETEDGENQDDVVYGEGEVIEEIIEEMIEDTDVEGMNLAEDGNESEVDLPGGQEHVDSNEPLPTLEIQPRASVEAEPIETDETPATGRRTRNSSKMVELELGASPEKPTQIEEKNNKTNKKTSRPEKNKSENDSQATAVSTPAATPRKRGRPPKKSLMPKPTETTEDPSVAVQENTSLAGSSQVEDIPKERESETETTSTLPQEQEPPAKKAAPGRPRGRRSKVVSDSPNHTPPSSPPPPTVSSRGRRVVKPRILDL